MESARAASLADQWGLDLEPMDRGYGDWNEILFARRSGERCVLKMTGYDHSATEEAAALATWNGRGAVRVLESAPDALLLERLDPDTSLDAVAFPEARERFAELLRRLSVTAPAGLPLLTDTAREISEMSDVPFDILPPRWLAEVRRLAADLADDPGDVLVHGDLHSGNILAGLREPWLAIDPKPTTGHPERSLAEFLWTRLDEIDDVVGTLARIVRGARLDLERARAWTIVRTARYLIWAVENGLTEDPVRCRRLVAALLN